MSRPRAWKAAAWTSVPGAKPTDVQRGSFQTAHLANQWVRKRRAPGRNVAVWYVDQLPPAELDDQAVAPAAAGAPTAAPALADPGRGAKLKADGMHRAAANTRADWARTCDAAIALLAAAGQPFQAADLVSAGVSEPDHPNQWGPRLAAAALRGVIAPAGYTQSSRATVRRSATRVCRGAGAGSVDVA